MKPQRLRELLVTDVSAFKPISQAVFNIVAKIIITAVTMSDRVIAWFLAI